jgi:hypothetical protein
MAIGMVVLPPRPEAPSLPVRLPPRPPVLAGREELLADLDSRLAGGAKQFADLDARLTGGTPERSGQSGPRLVVLYGLGGAGKTSVAVAAPLLGDPVAEGDAVTALRRYSLITCVSGMIMRT